MHRSHIAAAGLLLLAIAVTVLGLRPPKTGTLVVHMVDGAGAASPGLVCIRNLDDDRVWIPPGIEAKPSTTKDFAMSFHYDGEPDWVGPVRKTTGRGDNEDRSTLYTGPSLPFWTEPVMVQLPPSFTIELPVGRYRLSVNRGLEFVPVYVDVDVTVDGVTEQTVTLERWVHMAKRGWYSGDVHVHHAAGQPTQRNFLLHYAQAADLNVVNSLWLFGHDGGAFEQDWTSTRACHEDGPYCIAAGQEDQRNTFGHLLALNTSAEERRIDGHEPFRYVRQQPGALVGAPHASLFQQLPLAFPAFVTTEELDFVEVLQFGALDERHYYGFLDLGFRLTAAAGSDLPWGSVLGEVRTYVQGGDELDLDDWFANLGRGRTFVTNGPMLELRVDRAHPGTVLQREPGPVPVSARAWGHPLVAPLASLEIVGTGAVVLATGRVEGDALVVDVDLDVQRSQWVTAIARASNGAVAHTTPVYIEVDGQPTWAQARLPAIVEQQLEVLELLESRLGEDQAEMRVLTADARAWYQRLLSSVEADSP